MYSQLVFPRDVSSSIYSQSLGSVYQKYLLRIAC